MQAPCLAAEQPSLPPSSRPLCRTCNSYNASNSLLCHAAGRSTIVTMTAVQRSGGVNVAAVGLTNMMNAGGAIKDFQLSGDSSRNGDSSDASASVQVGHS
jgi:hypothetical protein